MGSRPASAAVNAPAEWSEARPGRPLEPGAIDVWLADLEALPDRLRELLCEQERARAARFADERQAIMWARARGLLRELLAGYLGCEPRALRFALGEQGKPTIASPVPNAGSGSARGREGAPISFNISHSQELALYAIADAEMGEIGIDIEVDRPSVDALALAARMFGDAEAERLAKLDPPSRQREFLRVWVRHEAALKCRGVGIGGAIEDAQGATPWTAQLELEPAGAAAAVAAERAPRALRLLRVALE